MRKITPLIFATVILFTATPAGAQSCNVQKGDSMWRIAKEYNVIFSELLRLNRHFKNQNLIHPRDRVELPDGSTGASSGKANTSGTDARTDDTADKDASEQARAVLNLVNQERSRAGLSALSLDKRLNTAAQKKAEDMRNNNYFDHQSPTLGSPFDLMRSEGINYTTAGENIAAGQQSAKAVMESWMNSSGHRANILNKNYKHLGVGFCTGGRYGTYWVQEFTG